MKIAVLTDLHICEPGASNCNIDPSHRLDLALGAVGELAPDADLLVLLGDLVDEPSAESYGELKLRLNNVRCPIRFLVGNHDSRPAFKNVWPDALEDDFGFIQSSIVTESEILLFLDTLGDAGPNGKYCGSRQKWLHRTLSEASGKPAFIFMHHPPFELGTHSDGSRVQEHEEFARILEDVGNVRHIFVGHVHRAAAGSWNGIAWSSLHGTHLQVNLTFPGIPKVNRSTPAQIGLLSISGSNSVLHYHDFTGD